MVVDANTTDEKKEQGGDNKSTRLHEHHRHLAGWLVTVGDLLGGYGRLPGRLREWMV